MADGPDRDRGVDEAADWEQMNDEERERIELTTTGLYKSSQGGRWHVLHSLLAEHGDGELAVAARDLSDALWSADASKPVPPALLAKESALLQRLAELQQNGRADEAIVSELTELARRSSAHDRGAWPNVDDKIATERKTAAEHGNQRDKDGEDDHEEKARARAERAQAEAETGERELGGAGAGGGAARAQDDAR